MKNVFRLFFTGFAMGSADIVPGVSGGTIAFIFGVYEELIYSIKKLTGETLKLFLQLKFKKAINSIPFGFLVPLGIGVLSAFALLAGMLAHLLETQPVYIWSFFFGLIVASIIIVRKRVVTWDWWDIAAFGLAAIGAFYLVGLAPAQTPATPIAFIVAGAIAIVAMIMPGISGSFLLLLMGKYEQILTAVVERDIFVIGLVGIGAVLGLAVFARILSWLFNKHHDIAVATLTGFMLGSLRKVWPWKDVITTRINSKGIEVPLTEANFLPESINNEVIFAVLLAFVAAIAILYLDKIQATDTHTGDVEDKKFASKHKKAVSSQSHK